MQRLKHSSILTFGLAILLAVSTLTPPAQAQSAPSLRTAIDKAVSEVKPALVRIHVVSRSYRGGREVKYILSGSGVIIDEAGHVITNHHVAGHATRLMVTLTNKEEIEAELIGTDPLSDIAVIKLIGEPGQTFPVASFGDSDAVRVGDHVMAMGSPLALSQSVTLGIVSNVEMVMPRRMGYANFNLDGENVGSLVRWIAHDAVIYGGNSGGPLVNLAGEIIGINEISLGLSGAIPGNLARQVAEMIIEDGSVSRSWLGVSVQPLLKHGERGRGILVTGTIDGSPAAEAGLQSGDLILRMGENDIHVRFEEELPAFNRFAADIPIGSEIDMLILRDGEEKTLTLTTRARELRLPQQHELKEWGITVRNISFVRSRELKRKSSEGVIVTSVRAGGPAGEAKPGIKRNDIITEVDGNKITNFENLALVTTELTKDAEDPVPVLTTFERKARSHVTVVKVGISELNDPALEVKKAWLPAETQVITREIALAMKMPDLTGFRVTQIYGNGEDDDHLHIGDLILSVDGEKMTASAPEHYEELPTLIRQYKAGTETELSILRDGERMKIAVELLLAPQQNREMKKYRDDNFDYTARDVTFFDKANERWGENQEGVLVEEVKSGGWAALGMLQTGDLILEVDRNAISDINSLEEIMENVTASKPDAVLLKVLRGIYTLYIELEPRWEND